MTTAPNSVHAGANVEKSVVAGAVTTVVLKSPVSSSIFFSTGVTCRQS